MDNENNNIQGLPEAPASVTARVMSDKKFRLLFTLRDNKVSTLIAKFDEFQNAILKRGWRPESSNFFFEGGKKQLSLGNFQKTECSKCGAVAKKKSGERKDGTIWEGVFCSTGEDSHKVWLA